jgi:hypothetical protein
MNIIYTVWRIKMQNIRKIFSKFASSPITDVLKNVCSPESCIGLHCTYNTEKQNENTWKLLTGHSLIGTGGKSAMNRFVNVRLVTFQRINSNYFTPLLFNMKVSYCQKSVFKKYFGFSVTSVKMNYSVESHPMYSLCRFMVEGNMGALWCTCSWWWGLEPMTAHWEPGAPGWWCPTPAMCPAAAAPPVTPAPGL